MLKLDKASGTGLARRIFSAAILAIVSLSMLLLSPFSFWLLLGGIAGICAYEILRFVDWRTGPLWGSGGLLLLIISAISIGWLRYHEDGVALILSLFCITWATDTGALLAGKAIGGPKLIPSVSPNKTWSGAFGGLLCAMLVGSIAAILSGGSLYHWHIIAFILSLSAQLGDLIESALKRRFGVKDSSGLIPGHGGMLDRVDGLILAGLTLTYWTGFAPDWVGFLFPNW